MTMIDCREAVRRMWAYLGHGLDDPAAEEFEEHLGVCQRCCGELELSRQLQEMVARSGAEPIPPAVRNKVERLLRETP